METPEPKSESNAQSAWRKPAGQASLPEVHRSVVVPVTASFWRKLFAFSGPGFLIAVGYMDPGNWATDLAGGAQFGYTLLSVVMISNLMAILLQHLSIKLGIATGRDLAQACRDHYSTPTVWFLWILCEIAIAACDLAEVVGSAIALQLLFGIPLVWGCVITALDVLAVLFLQTKGFRYLESLVITLIATIAACFTAELIFSKPEVGPLLLGFIPSPEILKNQNMLYVAIGIIGATVMPHNLYLHSSIVQTRKYEQNAGGRREAIKFATIDSTVALMFALLVNGGILALAAAAFHWSGHQDVAEIQDAYKLLSPLLGVGGAGILFAVALLASGQNSTLTGTLAGQVVMEGFVNIRLRPWLRRLITRLIAIVPAVGVIGFFGESKTTQLLVASQVVLSMQLGFAIWPLMRFTSERAKMGEFANRLWLKILGWTTAAIIIILNVKLLFDTFMPVSALKFFYGQLGLPVPRTMTAMYQHILVPLENSATDRAILDHIKPLVQLTGAKLLLLHVADGWVARNFNQLKLAESEEMKEDREYLETIAAALRHEGFAISIELALGDPPGEIIKVAESAGCDLIAMAGHGHRFFGDLFHGSTITQVRHHTTIPLLVLLVKKI